MTRIFFLHVLIFLGQLSEEILYFCLANTKEDTKLLATCFHAGFLLGLFL
jgi:hypothetical protein